MSRFKNYVAEADAQDVGPAPVSSPPGEVQRDPEAPSRVDKLVSSLKEIIALAKRAMDDREDGLASASGNDSQNDNDHPDKDNVVSRTKADSPAGMYGED